MVSEKCSSSSSVERSRSIALRSGKMSSEKFCTFLAKSSYRASNYLRMVESKIRQSIRRPPSSSRGVGCSPDVQFIRWKEHEICNGDHTAARVAVWFAKIADVMNIFGTDMCLLLQFAPGTVVQRFILFEKPAWQCPFVCEGIMLSLDEED